MCSMETLSGVVSSKTAGEYDAIQNGPLESPFVQYMKHAVQGARIVRV